MAKYNGVDITCNHIAGEAQCEILAVWSVMYGPSYMDYNHTCDGHVADFLSDERPNTVTPIEMDL